jgi:hypothetical protein
MLVHHFSLSQNGDNLKGEKKSEEYNAESNRGYFSNLVALKFGENS